MNGSPDMLITALKMFVALGLVLGGMWGVLVLLKRMSKKAPAGGSGRLINVLASSYIGFKKNIALVEVPGAVLVLGITNDAITLLTRIDRADLDKEIEMNDSAEKPAAFSDQLKRIMSDVGLGRR